MPKQVKKQEAVKVESVDKDLFDGGIVSMVISKQMRAELESVAARMDRTMSWVQREALKNYLRGFGGAA